MGQIDYAAWERQMMVCMESMNMIPPSFIRAGDQVDRVQTPTQMEAARLQAARVEQMERSVEAVQQAPALIMRGTFEQPEYDLHNGVPQQIPREEPVDASIIRGTFEAPEPLYSLNWTDPALALNPLIRLLKKKKNPVIPEAKTMNNMAHRIHMNLGQCITLCRGSNAWMAYSKIIEERLILKDPFDANDLNGEVAYLAHTGKTERMKLGRFIRRQILKENVLPENVFQECIEGLVNHFFPKCDFRVDSGDAITRNYENNVGGGSCMSGDHAGKVAMYADNPNCFSQLIGKQNRNTARAIIFHMDDGYKMLGRVYCGSNYLIDMMYKYAEDKGWMVESRTGLKLKGEDILDYSKYDLRISDVEYHEGGVPYMDSFENADVGSNGKLTLYYSNGGDYCLTDTCGFLRDGCWCCHCDEAVAMDDSFSTEDGYYCTACYEECFTTCDECEETIRIIALNNTADGAVCNSCINDYVECVHCNDFHHQNKIHCVDDESVCEDCLESQYNMCEECNEYVLIDETSDVDGRELCESCKETEYATTE